MANKGNPGINKLAYTLSQRIKRENESGLIIDYGVINQDYSLKTNTFSVAIPKADYVVCRQLESGGGLSPNDRVLVAWIQNDAVIIDLISS